MNPRADERCETAGVDDDCDGEVDEDDAVDATSWYPDADGDGYRDSTAPVTACAAPEDTIADGTDCNDGSADVYPGAPKICDGEASDCADTTWVSDAGLASFKGLDSPWG